MPTWTKDAAGNFVYQRTEQDPPLTFRPETLDPRLVAKLNTVAAPGAPVDVSNPNAFVGPSKEGQHWDTWSDEQKAKYDKALALVEGIKLYQSAGKTGAAAQFAPHYQELMQGGGLTPEHATSLARYRMWKQGMANVPMGERTPELTDEQKAARAQAFVGGTPQQRQAMQDEDRDAIARSHEAYFDSLVQQPAPSAPVAMAETPPS